MRKKKLKKRSDKIIIILVFVLMLSLGCITILKSNFFNLSKIEINGNKYIKDDEILNKDKIEINKNIFTYNLNEIENNILSNPYIENANVKIKLPNKLVVSIEEVEVIALLSNKKDFCYIDNNGNIIEKINTLEENSGKIVFETEYDLGEYNIISFKNEKNKKSIFNLINFFKKEHLDYQVTKVEYINESQVYVWVNDNTKFLINDDDNLEYNISRLSKILVDLNSKKIKTGMVDLTYSNYAVYKPS